ncbi:SsrA-binding protein SmpB [Candidatus Roizmanbacteria bacterium]|nr:SsrA-binding protein SmpB [Candidatus Roizmanbacteria bacterium]
MKIVNRKFHRDYQELEKYEAGIALSGPEVKSVRMSRMRLEDSFVKILGSEAYLVNAQISLYERARIPGYDDRRTRKLLLHKKELIRLKTKLQSSKDLTIVPVSCYNKGDLIKLGIALAKGRKNLDKRRLEKNKDIRRREEREIKEYLKS